MKMIITILLSSFLFSCSSVTKRTEDKHLKTEIKSGKYYTSKITYRNGKKIMEEVVTEYKNRHSKTRMIYFNGKLKFIETDEDNDGFFETVLLYDNNIDPSDFEIFIRDKTGEITPLPSVKLKKKQKKILDALKRFQTIYKQIMIKEKKKRVPLKKFQEKN